MKKRRIARRIVELSLTAAIITGLLIHTVVSTGAQDTVAPGTGDDSHILTYVFVLLVSVTALAVVLLIIKKRSGKK